MTCSNCSAAVTGAYCSSCGQSQEEAAVSLWSWLKRLLDDQFALSGRLPVTLRHLYARPGFLTHEWRMGRRVRFVEPLRIYTLSLLIFLTVLFTISSPFDALLGMMPAPRNPEVLRAAQTVMEQELRRFVVLSLLVLVPAVAVVLKLLYARRRIFLVEHLIFSLHVHAALMLPLALLAFLISLFAPLIVLGLGFIIVFPVYLHQAVRRAYDDEEQRSAVRVVALVAAYVAVLAGIAAVQWAPLERRLMAEFFRVGDEVEAGRLEQIAHGSFRAALMMPHTGDTAYFRERVQMAIEAQGAVRDAPRRMYQTAELYLLLDDTAAVRRLVRVGSPTDMRLPFMALDARLHERRGAGARAKYEEYTRAYDAQGISREVAGYRPMLEWTRARAR